MIIKIINFPIKAAKILVGITKTVIQVANTRTIKIATQIQISTMIKATITVCKMNLKNNFVN
jgi:hypothetical protein